MNRPPSLIKLTDRLIDSYFLPQHAYWSRLAGWYVKRYAHLAGLDNRWKMFGRQSRFNWWYVIKAHYANGAKVILPLPRQSRRTFWQRTLADFKEAKFHLNIYRDAIGREAYAHYLCRQYPTHRSSPIESIVFELHYQNIVTRQEAAQLGTHLDPIVYSQNISQFECSGSGNSS